MEPIMNWPFRLSLIKSARQTLWRRTLRGERHVCVRLRDRDPFMAACACDRSEITEFGGVRLRKCWRSCDSKKQPDTDPGVRGWRSKLLQHVCKVSRVWNSRLDIYINPSDSFDFAVNLRRPVTPLELSSTRVDDKREILDRQWRVQYKQR
jgi:hypothetical protein